MTELNDVGLRMILKKADSSVEELAKYLNISKATVYRKLSGESDFYREEIDKVCDFLKDKGIPKSQTLNYFFWT